MEHYRKTPTGILYPAQDERKWPRTPINAGCCSFHWLPTDGSVCEYFDNKINVLGGILLDDCKHCFWYEDNPFKVTKRQNFDKRLAEALKEGE